MTTRTDAALEILSVYDTFAVVGCSPDPARPSYGVARFLQAKGYDVIPVNPTCPECLGMPTYPDLSSIPAGRNVEVVDIFRRSEFVGPIVDEAIAVGAKAIWMQVGVRDDAAARRAEQAGLDVVMDTCPKIEYPRLAARR